MNASLFALDTSAHLNLKPLDVWFKGPLGNTPNLDTVTAQIFGLTALGVAVPGVGLLAAIFALFRHDWIHLCQKSLPELFNLLYCGAKTSAMSGIWMKKWVE